MKISMLLISIVMCTTGIIHACCRELTGEENRKVLLSYATYTCKGVCWPQTCASQYPNCPLSQERRTYNSIMARLTDQIGPRYSAGNQIKEKALACYTDTCSHPICACGTAIAATAFTLLSAFGWIGSPDCTESVLPELALVPLPGCSLIADHYCRAYLTDPAHWDHGIDADSDESFSSGIHHATNDGPHSAPDMFDDLS